MEGVSPHYGILRELDDQGRIVRVPGRLEIEMNSDCGSKEKGETTGKLPPPTRPSRGGRGEHRDVRKERVGRQKIVTSIRVEKSLLGGGKKKTHIHSGLGNFLIQRT